MLLRLPGAEAPPQRVISSRPAPASLPPCTRPYSRRPRSTVTHSSPLPASMDCSLRSDCWKLLDRCDLHWEEAVLDLACDVGCASYAARHFGLPMGSAAARCSVKRRAGAEGPFHSGCHRSKQRVTPEALTCPNSRRSPDKYELLSGKHVVRFSSKDLCFTASRHHLLATTRQQRDG